MNRNLKTYSVNNKLLHQKRRFYVVFLVQIFLLPGVLMASVHPAIADEVLVDGFAWRQLTDTAGAGLSWADVASVCPLDETPCEGSVKGVDFTGWIWASRQRVDKLFYTLTGWSIGDSGSFSSDQVELFFDLFEPVFVPENDTAQLSHGIYSLPEIPVDAMVGAVYLLDAKVNSGSDKIDETPIDISATEGSGTFFGNQPLGVFLVRDPALELCSNGIDDDGDGLADIEDDDCAALNPVIAGREWRQLTVTQNLPFWDVANICPAGGTPCAGAVGSIDFDGWIWASGLEVVDMLEILTGLRMGNSWTPIYDPSYVPKVFQKFKPTLALDTADILYGLTYDSVGERPPLPYPDVGVFLDPLTCFNGIDDNGNGAIDFPADGACGSGRMVGISDYFENSDSVPDGMRGAPAALNFPAMRNPYYGYFLYRAPVLATHESCDNTFDDDGDGLIDAEDSDCVTYEPFPDLLVRCIHEPLWAQEGEQVTIRAEAIGGDGVAKAADRIQIFVNDGNNAVGETRGQDAAQIVTVATGRSLHYGCLAELGQAKQFSGWRDTDIGTPELGDIPAIPVIYNGKMKNKLDILFLPELSRHPLGASDPQFLSDIYRVIKEGIYSIPWFVRNQRDINFWIGKEFGQVLAIPDNPLGTCIKINPQNYRIRYGFADAAGIIHDQDCRDNASLEVFTTKYEEKGFQVVAHEIGHAAFTLSDEYMGASTLYFTLPKLPNLFPTEGACRSAAYKRGQSQDACRALVIEGFSLGGNWIFEPDYSLTTPQTPDLMQQTGFSSCAAGSGCESYRVGPSEIDRMNWKLGKCRSGRC
ncbi:MAG: hypothetical protein R3E64_03085 [Halioglobus sp.]